MSPQYLYMMCSACKRYVFKGFKKLRYFDTPIFVSVSVFGGYCFLGQDLHPVAQDYLKLSASIVSQLLKF